MRKKTDSYKIGEAIGELTALAKENNKIQKIQTDILRKLAENQANHCTETRLEHKAMDEKIVSNASNNAFMQKLIISLIGAVIGLAGLAKFFNVPI